MQSWRNCLSSTLPGGRSSLGGSPPRPANGWVGGEGGGCPVAAAAIADGESDRARRAHSTASLAGGAVGGANIKVNGDGAEVAGVRAPSAADAPVAHPAPADPQQARQRKPRPAGAHEPAPEPPPQKPQQQHARQQPHGQPQSRVGGGNHAPVLRQPQVCPAGRELEPARQQRDRREVPAERHTARCRDQQAPQQIEPNVSPTAWAADVQPAGAAADQPIEPVDQCAQRTDVSAERPRQDHARAQHDGGAEQGGVPGSPSQGGGGSDQRVQPEEDLRRQPGAGLEQARREVVRPGGQEEQVQEGCHRCQLKQSADRGRPPARPQHAQRDRDQPPQAGASGGPGKKDVHRQAAARRVHFRPACLRALYAPSTMACEVTVAPVMASTLRLC